MGNISANFGIAPPTERKAEVPSTNSATDAKGASTNSNQSGNNANAESKGSEVKPDGKPAVGDKPPVTPDPNANKSGEFVPTDEEREKLRKWDEEEKLKNAPNNQNNNQEPNNANVEEVIAKLPKEMQDVLRAEVERKKKSETQNPFSKVLDEIPDDDKLHQVAKVFGDKIGGLDDFRKSMSQDVIKMAGVIDEQNAMIKAMIAREVNTQISEAQRYYAGRVDFDANEVRALALSGKIPYGPEMIVDHILKTNRDRVVNAERERGRQQEIENQRKLADGSTVTGSGNSSVVANKELTRDELLKKTADELRERHGIKQQDSPPAVKRNINNLFGLRKSA